MYYCLKFNSLSGAHAVCFLFLLISVWMMNLAYRILLPGFHASTREHRNTPRALQNDPLSAPARV